MINRLEKEIHKTTIRFILTSVILLGAAIALSVIWNRSIKDELAIQASSFVRKGISTKEMRGVVEYLNGVQFSAFTHVSLYSSTVEHIITLPPIFDRRNKTQSLSDQILYSSITIPIYLDTESKILVARAIFTYSRFELVPYAILIWLISALLLAFVFSQAKKKVEIEFKKEVRLKNAELTEEIAKKVRHNIRSPLASLRAIFIEKMFSPEMIFDQGIGVIKRLEEIIEELQPNHLSASSSLLSLEKATNRAVYDVVSMVKSIISEKKLISKQISILLTIETQSPGIYTLIPSSEFKPMLSNIIDNSLQAILGQGSVHILLSADEVSFWIEVKDSGIGIAKENLTKVFDKHFTSGKEGGSGLGLYYAKKLVELNLGNIEINSELGSGTTLSMIVPRIKTPAWHLDSINLKNFDSITLCDDQQTMIDTWKIKFSSALQPLPIQSFNSCEAMESKLDLNNSSLFLVDYDLGENKITGLEFLKRHETLAKQYILVTGHFDEPWLQAECARLSCKLLPKDSIFQIEIN